MKGEAKDRVELQLALKMCRADLTNAQEELNRMKAEYWDVMPRRNWDQLEKAHKQTLLEVVQTDMYTVCTVHTCMDTNKIHDFKTVICLVLFLYFLCCSVEDPAG